MTPNADILALYKRKSKDCPKGVRLQLQRGKFLMAKFINPSTDKYTARSLGEPFTDQGILNAVDKCWHIKDARDRCTSDGEFWAWFEQHITGTKQLQKTIKTYQQIFEKIEADYFNSTNRNTHRQRSREIHNDVKTFNNYYGLAFRLFPDPDDAPSLQGFKSALSTFTPGTKQYKDVVFALKKIAKQCHDSRRILEFLNTLNVTQTTFRESQSISLEDYLQWFRTTQLRVSQNRNSKHRQQGNAWLSVTALCVVYALRPSEAAAVKNLTTPWESDGVTFHPVLSNQNPSRLLFLSDFTSFGASIKTGNRACIPMLRDEALFEELLLEATIPKTNGSRCDQFLTNLLNWLRRNQCPVTQSYAFRHLGNQLGERYGINQETRSRSMGHSVTVNESVYKSRTNLKTTIELLTHHNQQPLGLDAARRSLRGMGIDPDWPEVSTILTVIYQLES